MESNKDLIRAWRNGDSEAFGQVVEAYKNAVYATTLSLVNDVHQAQDLTAETFVQAHHSLHTLQEPAKVGGWLRSIARNRALNWFNRQRRREVSYEGFLEEAPWREIEFHHAVWSDQIPCPPDRMVEQQEMQRLLWRGLYALPEISREVLLLFYLRQQPQREIALYLVLSLTAVRNRLYDARRRIRKEFSNMLKDTVGQQSLPNDFTPKVVHETLQRGQTALAEGAWQKARESFLRVLDLQPDSQQAFQGLGEAAVQDIEGRLAQPQGIVRREDLDRAYADLEQAYRLGGRKVKSVEALAGLYHRFQRCDDFVEVLWDFALNSDDSRAAFKAGCRSLFEMGQQCVENYDRAMEGHQLLLDKFAGKITLVDQLDSYILMSSIFGKKGKQKAWLAATVELEEAMGEHMFIAQRFFYTRTRALVLRHLSRHKEAITTVDHFVEWIDQTQQQHPHKVRMAVEIQGQGMRSYHELGNVAAVRETIVQAERRLEQYHTDRQAFLERTQGGGEETRLQLEAIYQRMMDYGEPDRVVYEAPLVGASLEELHTFMDQKYQSGIAAATFNLAGACSFIGEGETAIRLFHTYKAYMEGSKEKGLFRHSGNLHAWLAKLMLSVRRDRDMALTHLRQAAQDSRWVAAGHLKRTFDIEAFDPVRADEDFLAVVNTSVVDG